MGTYNYTDNDIIEKSKIVFTMAQLLKSLGLKPSGGNYDNMRRKLQILNLDCSHWTGQAWSKSQQLKDWSEYKSKTSIKPHLISLRGHKCEECKLDLWLESPIPLELHHIDGNRTNNELENLQLVCPNCHAFTDNYRGKNIFVPEKIKKNTYHKRNKEKINKTCKDCTKQISPKATRCKSCTATLKQSTRSKRPSQEQLLEDRRILKSFSAIGRKYSVSDNAVRKWFKTYNLNTIDR